MAIPDGGVTDAPALRPDLLFGSGASQTASVFLPPRALIYMRRVGRPAAGAPSGWLPRGWWLA
jgi:hypothetical protein